MSHRSRDWLRRRSKTQSIITCTSSNRRGAYDPVQAGLDRDLTLLLGPIEPVLARIDPLLLNPPHLTPEDFENLVAFVRTGLLDTRAQPRSLCSLIPATVPSGMLPLRFEGCPKRRN